MFRKFSSGYGLADGILDDEVVSFDAANKLAIALRVDFGGDGNYERQSDGRFEKLRGETECSRRAREARLLAFL